jgi:hypothetical protein
VDEISSGLDPSASNYVVSSSYPDGNLVRSGGRLNQRNTGSTAGGTAATINQTISNTSTSSGSGSSGSAY